MSLPSRLELESEIYGIVKILHELQKKVEMGQVPFFTYHEMIREKIRDLLFIELIFKKKGMDIENIIDDMNVSDKFLDIIPQIKNFILFKNLEIKANQDMKKISQFKTITDTNSFDGKNMQNQENESNALKFFNEYRRQNHITFTPSNIIQEYQKQANRNIYQNESILLNNTLFNPMTLARVAADTTSDFITILDFFQLKLTDLSVLFQLADSLSENLKKFPGMEELAIEVSLFIKDLKQKTKPDMIDYSDLYSRFEKFYLGFKKRIILQSYQ